MSLLRMCHLYYLLHVYMLSCPSTSVNFKMLVQKKLPHGEKKFKFQLSISCFLSYCLFILKYKHLV